MKAILLVLFILAGGILVAQDIPVVRLQATILNADKSKKIPDVTFEVFQDTVLYMTEKSSAKGKVPIMNLPITHVYIIKVKKNGFVTKVIKLDTHVELSEDLGKYTPLEIQTSLFESLDGVDCSYFESTPMIEFKMDKDGLLQYDEEKLKLMQNKLEELRVEMKRKN